MLKLCVIKTKDNFEFKLGLSFLAIKICDLILEAIQIHLLIVNQSFVYHIGNLMVSVFVDMK